jgi:hypothetical protein
MSRIEPRPAVGVAGTTATTLRPHLAFLLLNGATIVK